MWQQDVLPWVQNEDLACVSSWHWCYILVAESAAKFGPPSLLGSCCLAAKDNNICGSSSASPVSAFAKYFKFCNVFCLSGKGAQSFSVRTGNCGLCQKRDRCLLTRASACFILWKCGLYWGELGGGALCLRLPVAARHWCESQCLDWMDFLCWSVSQFLSPLSGSAPELRDTRHLCFSCCRFLFLLPNNHKTGVNPPPHPDTHTNKQTHRHILKNISSGCHAVGAGVLTSKSQWASDSEMAAAHAWIHPQCTLLARLSPSFT